MFSSPDTSERADVWDGRSGLVYYLREKQSGEVNIIRLTSLLMTESSSIPSCSAMMSMSCNSFCGDVNDDGDDDDTSVNEVSKNKTL